MKNPRLTAALAAIPLLAAAALTPSSAAAADPAGAVDDPAASVKHDFRSPMAVKQDQLRQQALEQVIDGKATPRGRDGVVKVAKGQYVDLEREQTDKIFVVLAEFGDRRHTGYEDAGAATPKPQRFDGPLHNQIPQPDRSVDNSTIWQPDYDQAHYQDMYFNRMADYYQGQSSGRYSVDGDVTEWVKVPFNEARYGRDNCGSIVCGNVRYLIRDALAEWTKTQLDSGKSMKQIQAYLKTFDVQDRYDYDADGDFNEPDGYIDHFQVVHAGGDQAAGDPLYEADAIWSHRSYASLSAGGPAGGAQFGGTEIGAGGTDDGVAIPNNPTGVWVGDYTMQPENGGLGVFSHEFGHDLGLPDLYDTSGNTGGAENNTAFWTLMSSGSYLSKPGAQSIGDQPGDLGAWEKLQLGWLDYALVDGSRSSSTRLGPSTANTKQAQALITTLPAKEVENDLGQPCATCGEKFYFSGAGDNLSNTMTRSVSGGGQLSAQARWEIESGYDYAFLEASSDGGSTWTPLKTSASVPSGDGDGDATSTGISGTQADWTQLTATVPAGTDTIRFRYSTDGGLALAGFQVDQITLGGQSIGTAETDDQGWTLDGFRTTTGIDKQLFANYYIAENRQYVANGQTLRTAYNFGFAGSRPDFVEKYPYQDGLLINYWDTSYLDNNVGDHPGGGLVLPVDAHPTFEHWRDGTLMRPRIASYDSTFGLDRTDALRLHNGGVTTKVASKPAVPVFDDTRTWWSNADQHAATGGHVGRYQPGWYGVDVPRTGTTIRVKSVSGTGFMQVGVAPKK